MRNLKKHVMIVGLAIALQGVLRANTATPELAASSESGAQCWEQNFTTAQMHALEEGKYLLIYFRGANKGAEATLLSSQFLEKVGAHFTCVDAGSPSAAQSLELQERYHLGGTPTLLVMEASEREIMRIAYIPESSLCLANDLLRALEQDQRLQEGLQHLDSSLAELHVLYAYALELGQEEARVRILEAATHCRDIQLGIERYRYLVARFGIDAPQTRECRATLVAQDTANRSKVAYSLALIDFQEKSKKSASPAERRAALAPLEEYMQTFGDKDGENIWRLEMLMAQFYLEGDAWGDAYTHATCAFDKAPACAKERIGETVDYIKTQVNTLR